MTGALEFRLRALAAEKERAQLEEDDAWMRGVVKAFHRRYVTRIHTSHGTINMIQHPLFDV